MLNRLTSPQDPIALFKMQSCAMLERNTAPPGGNKIGFPYGKMTFHVSTRLR